MRNMRRHISRQSFLTLFIMGFMGLGGLAATIPVIGTLLGPIVKAPPHVWRDVGAVEQYL